MKTNKHKTSWKIVLSALLAVLMGCAIFGYSLLGNNTSKALTDVPETTTVTKPLYDFDQYCYDAEALNMLAQQVLGDPSADIDKLIKYAQTEAGIMGKPVENKNITLQYGQYQYSSNNSPNPLVWLPVYVSRTSSTNEAVLTLYLAATSTLLATSQQETGFFTNVGSYSTNYAANPPSNSYGASYMRAASLGNGGEYAYYPTTNASSGTMSSAKVEFTNYNKFSNFVKGYDFTGDLYDDIVTPSEIKWQETESYVDYVDENGYNWPNEAYGTPANGSFYYPNYFNSYTTSTNYSIWQNDKVWLPSLTELGNGDRDGNGVGTLNGIWETTNNQRKNPQKAWLRSAANNVNRTDGYSTYTMYCTDENGNIATNDLNVSPYINFQGLAIRPAIHLNLSKIKTKTTPPVNIPDVVSTVYNGEEQVISQYNCTLPAEQVPWFRNDGTMIVTFYAGDDEECVNGAVPALNAGTYYMLVQRIGSSWDFHGQPAGTTRVITKFVIEKAKVGVEWEYDSESVPHIKNIIVDNEIGDFYPGDIRYQNVPTISLCYRNTGGTGGTFYEYPDKKGYYEAYAYIVDEDIHNYNYELAEVNGNRIKSNQFYVKQKPISKPYFKEGGEGCLEYAVSYKGRQYIEISNISSYLEVTVTSSPASAADTVERMGLTAGGVLVYRVQSVATYVFSVKIVDPVNIMWNTGTETNPDINNVDLKLDVKEAEISASFEGLPSSWATNIQMTFNLVVTGVQAGEDVSMVVRYLTPNGSFGTVTQDPDTGLYVIKSNLPIGVYTLMAALAGDGQWASNYQMTVTKTQKFEIVQTVSNFNESYVRWQYVNNGSNTTLASIGTGNTPSTAVSVGYNGNFYQFTLTLDESRLASSYVKAIYTGYKYSEGDNAYIPFDGAIYVKDAGSYYVKVTITAYDKNVDFNDQEYSVYFNIEKTTFDLSGVKWDYSSPLTYSGSEQKVLIKADSLPEGLTPSYIANTATNAGNYTATVRFLVSNDYVTNYEVPTSGNTSSYSGNFDFTLDWQINKQEIALVWDTGSSGSSDLLFIPVLKTGGSLVDYKYEHYENGSWVACTSVQPANTVTEKYRVSAELKNVYDSNYVLTGSTAPCEFEVQSGKYPVTVHFELNNIRCENGDEFAYTGSEFKATIVSDTNNTNVTGSVKYYTVDPVSGNRLTELNGAPVDVGHYCAVITANISSDSYLVGETSFNFTIVKADIDVSDLHWDITHGFDIISAYFDADLQKWVDAQGREVVLSFEYDGTPYTFMLYGFADGLTIGSVIGNSETVVGEYDTVVSFSWNENYNEPEFPGLVHWQIHKASIHFENVRWGYIDEDGNEYEFDEIPTDIYQNGKFLFTRNEKSAVNGPVKFTVGLINLPEGIKNLITYNSICLTQANGVEIPNCASFSAIGQYKTTLTIIGTFTDANYETFRSTDFPTSIPKFLEWEIAKRPLTKTSVNGSWVVFDDKTHDLIEISGIPYEELYYYQVEVTFLDTANGVYNYYEGYEGVAYAAHDAGIYTVRFYELVGDDAEPIFWDSYEIEVGKHSIEITWDLKGSIPVARATGVYISDMIGTKYTTLNGGEVTLEYIMSTNGEQEFYAVPYVTDDYANNLDFVMAEDQLPQAKFRYEQFKIDGNSQALYKSDVKFQFPTLEYTGEALTFVLDGWDAQFAPYLYYEGDSLTQTEIGTYNIVVSFIKYDSLTGDGNAYWAGTESLGGDRSSITLEFNIVARTKMPLAYPKLNAYSAPYTGSPIEFVITNWILLQDYIYYTVSYNGTVDCGTQLTQVRAGLYTITFNFYEDSIGYWNDDPTNPKKEYKIQFEITDPNVTTKTLLDPRLSYNSVETDKAEYTGNDITFSIVDWDSYYSQYVDVVIGSLTNVNPGTYTVTLAVKLGVNAIFSNGKAEYELTYTIVSSDPNAAVPLEKPKFVTSSQVHTGSDLLFELKDWDSVYGAYLEISGDSLTESEVGEYSITVSFKSTSRAYWADNNSRDSIVLKFYVLDSAPVDDVVRLDPNEIYIVIDQKEYTGNEIQFDINNWEYFRDYITIDGGADYLSLLKTEVGEYSISVEIKLPGQVTWVGGSVTPIALRFRITQATITIGGVDEEGKLIITNNDGERVDGDSFFDYVYRDEDGNIVDVNDLEDGKTYYVTVKLKPDKIEDFNDCFTNDADEFSQELDKQINTENGGKGVSFVKSPSTGISPMLIITIAICGVLILLVIATIIVLAVKRREYADDDVQYVDYEEDD